MEVRIGPLESCASCASVGAVRAISPDLGNQGFLNPVSHMHNLIATVAALSVVHTI
jgi:hypothetical protein